MQKMPPRIPQNQNDMQMQTSNKNPEMQNGVAQTSKVDIEHKRVETGDSLKQANMQSYVQQTSMPAPFQNNASQPILLSQPFMKSQNEKNQMAQSIQTSAQQQQNQQMQQQIPQQNQQFIYPTQAQIDQIVQSNLNTYKINFDLQLQQMNQQLEFERKKCGDYLVEITNMKQQNQEIGSQLLKMQKSNLSSTQQVEANQQIVDAQSKEIADYKHVVKSLNQQVKQQQEQINQLSEKNQNFSLSVANLLELIEKQNIFELKEPQKPQLPKKSNKLCPFCGETDCEHARPLKEKPDKAARVIEELQTEVNELQYKLNLCAHESFQQPEKYFANMQQINDLIESIKSRKKNIRELSNYKAQVRKLGVNIK